MNKRLINIIGLVLLLLSPVLSHAQATQINYQYWIDNNKDAVVSGTTTDGAALNLSVDVANLSSGIHFLNMRARKGKEWGTVYRKLFAIPRAANAASSQLARYEYWIDNDYAHRVSKTVSGSEGTVVGVSDLSSLSPGIHFFNMRVQGNDGAWGSVKRQIFSIPREQQTSADKQITGYRYGFDGNMTTVTLPSPVSEYTLTQAFDAPEPPLPTTIDDDCHFSFSGTTATLMRNVEMTFALTFTDESKAMSSPVGTTFTVTDLRTSDILSLAVPGSLTVPDHTTGGYTVMKFDIATSGTYSIKSSSACSLRLYSSTGAQLCTVESEALTAGYSQEYESGTYYAVAYGNTANATLTINVSDVNLLKPTLTYADDAVTISSSLDGATFYYTLDGSDPTTASTRYETPIPVDRNLTVKAIASWAGIGTSPIASLTIDIFSVVKPVITHEGNVVTITTTTEGATIHYTTDGSDPTAESTVYTAPFTATENGTIKAIALRDGYYDSEVEALVVDWIIVGTPCSYAILDTETGTLTFKYGIMPEGDNVWNTDNTDFVDESLSDLYKNRSPWVSDNLIKVVFETSYAEARPQSTAYWFNGATKLEEITTLEYLNTSQVTTMDYMFGWCLLLTSLDVSHFDTSNVTSMSHTFYRCAKLTSLDVSNFETSKVTNMSGLFAGMEDSSASPKAGYLTSLDVSNFNTANVTDMSEMFSTCSGLTSLDVRNFNTSKVTNMSGMFSNLIDLTSLDVSNFDTGNVTDMSYMFSSCVKLTSLDIRNFNTANVTNMNSMFSVCSGLTSLDLSNFDTGNVTTMNSMFANCRSLTSLDLRNFDTGNVTQMSYMFNHSSSLTELDLRNFNTTNVTIMQEMFSSCNSLTGLDISQFDTGNVTTMNSMFANCRSLTSLDVSHFSTGNVTDMYRMFLGCSGLTSLDLSNFDTGNVTLMSSMFSGCSSLTTIFAGEGWSLESVISDSGNKMFAGCSKLVGGKGTSYNSSFVDKTYARIDGGPDAPGYLSVKGDVLTVESVQFTQNNSILTLTTVTEGATIKYSVDNGDWTTYSNPLAMEGEYTIQAYATKQGYKDSEISSYAFVYHRPVVATPIITHVGDVITIATATEGATIHYTTDGTAPTAQSLVYNGPFTVAENGTIKSIAICEGYQDSEVSSLTVNWIIIGKTCGYVIHDLNSKTLTFYYGIIPANNRTEEGIYIWEVDNTESYKWSTYSLPWLASGINTVIFDSSFAQARPSSTRSWFSGGSNLTIIGIEYLNTEEVTDMAWMFQDCKKLTSIDLSHFNTSKVKDMSWMFSGCSNLESLDLSHFDTSKVKDMSWMFSLCYGLKSLNLMNFNTSSVTNMAGMFCGCNVISLDLSSFDTSEVQSMENMFSGSSIKELDLSNFNTKNVITMDEMFRNCENLTTVYAGDDWIIRGQEFWMMAGCINIVGGLGTKYDPLMFCEEYARIDGGPSAPGYFTKGYVKGDANGDGVVTADDVKAVENYILGIESAKFFFLASDMNSDGEINAADIVALINLIGNQQKD